MNREIDTARQQRFFQLFGEEPLAAHVCQRPILNPVAGGFYGDDIALGSRLRLDRAPHHLGLRLCQLRAAGADTQSGENLRHGSVRARGIANLT
jgi:hypothetical protein